MTETEAFLDLEYHYDEGFANTGRIIQISDRNDPSRRRQLRLRFLGSNPPPPSRIPQSRKDNGCEPGPNQGVRDLAPSERPEGGVEAIHPNDVEGPPGPDRPPPPPQPSKRL
jgi:hypothetical protein